MIAIPVAAFMGSVAMIVGPAPQTWCNHFGLSRPMIAIPTADDCGSLQLRSGALANRGIAMPDVVPLVPENRAASRTGAIEIEIGGAVLRADAGIDLAVLGKIVRLLKATGSPPYRGACHRGCGCWSPRVRLISAAALTAWRGRCNRSCNR